METLAILLSVPAAVIACTLYCLFLAAFISKFARVSRLLIHAGIGVLVLSAVEIALLATIGAVASRAHIGPLFYPAHLIVFFFGPAALANVLVLRRHPETIWKWYVAAPVCAVYAVILVLMQYAVTDALYGVDGTGGPYGRQF